jgi:hypothetical protein
MIGIEICIAKKYIFTKLVGGWDAIVAIKSRGQENK